MRSYLPIFLLVGGILLVSLVGFIFFNLRSKQITPQEEVAEKELVAEERPYVRLVPNSAGNELSFSVSRIPAGVSTIEYELTYIARAQPPDTGRVTQGVPGQVDVEGKTSIEERKLTLGTCSGRVCRYDKDVGDINLAITLRDKKGKLISKFKTGVKLVTKKRELASDDGKLTFTFDKIPIGYWLVMQTIGLPSSAKPGESVIGPYGIFSSSKENVSGMVTISSITPEVWDGSRWTTVPSGQVKVPGVFTAVASR